MKGNVFICKSCFDTFTKFTYNFWSNYFLWYQTGCISALYYLRSRYGYTNRL